MRVYVAGPMRSVEKYNWPAFDAAAERLRKLGHDVVSPADLDRAAGWTEDTPIDAFGMAHAMARDLPALCGCDAIALLPGWHKSRGVAIELGLARELGLAILDAITGEPFAESVLEEAARLVDGPRNADYGNPEDDLDATGALWSVYLRRKGLAVALDGSDVSMLMVLLKVSRHAHRRKRDNLADICGYSRCAERCEAQHDEI